ncbi:hypothetical protein KV205_25510 [Streptomyces sp. SKN60]|uniref:hypothetical protein n=1 Tax=Streptomyces sp. SKN60 TaxID=2855506 RepID=UPI0022461128|nr:hypothetical protein [Streptomyces sp. SKN60]MCX2183863.1 hypothetical protein [Streptomyces sp. SKN60]
MAAAGECEPESERVARHLRDEILDGVRPPPGASSWSYGLARLRAHLDEELAVRHLEHSRRAIADHRREA